MANHSISIARQFSVSNVGRFGVHSIPISNPHIYSNRLRYGILNISEVILSKNHNLITCSLWKLCIVEIFIISECKQMLPRNLQNMWSESSFVSTVNLVKKFNLNFTSTKLTVLTNIPVIDFFIGDYFLLAHPVHVHVCINLCHWAHKKHSPVHISQKSATSNSGGE